MTLVDLTPTNRGGSPVRASSDLARAFEAACEFVEGLGTEPFTNPDIFRACWSASAARHLIKAYLALGFIERISGPGARPVYYRVLPHALPKAALA